MKKRTVIGVEGKTMKKIAVIAAVVVVVIAAGWVILWRINVRAGGKEYDRIVKLMEAYEYDKAAPAWEELIEDGPSRFREGAERKLVECYLAIANDATLSREEQAAWYAKIDAIDPSRLDQWQRRMLEKYGSGP